MILNMTQHKSTPAQKAAGVRDLPKQVAVQIRHLLTFHRLPTKRAVESRAAQLADVLGEWAAEQRVPCGTRVMIGGAPFLMAPLVKELKAAGFKPVFAFSERESVEKTDSKGVVTKVTTFKHLGFVEA